MSLQLREEKMNHYPYHHQEQEQEAVKGITYTQNRCDAFIYFNTT